MFSTGSKESDILQLKQIIGGSLGEEVKLQQLKKFETGKSLQNCKILTRICGLVPLATSLSVLKDIISIFVRKLMVLLEEEKVLQNPNMSKSILDSLKRFWSFCSRQQNVVSLSRMFCEWHPMLLEEITPLASIFIDLFICAYGNDENRGLRSKQLYSWLNFDLPDRAIKIALLEAEGHSRDGAEIAGPLLSHVLSRKFDESSNPDYLLHFLLLKKWYNLTDVSDLAKVSRNLNAPPTFLSWLGMYWTDASKLMPDDWALKGDAVSKFLLDLNTDCVLEPMAGALQMAIFPDDFEDGMCKGNKPGNFSFVVDKKGKDEVHQSGMKRKASNSTEMREGEDNDIGDLENVVSSPKKKKIKTGMNDNETIKDNVVGFFLDRGRVMTKAGITDDDEKDDDDDDDDDDDRNVKNQTLSYKLKSGKQNHCLSKYDDDDEDSEKSQQTSRQSQNNHNVIHNEKFDIAEDITQKPSLRPRNMAAAVLKSKNILISDPVATSYFASEKQGTTRVLDSSLLSTSNERSLRSSPRINKGIKISSFPSEDEKERTSRRKSNSSPGKLAAESPLDEKRVERSKKGLGKGSPSTQKGRCPVKSNSDPKK